MPISAGAVVSAGDQVLVKQTERCSSNTAVSTANVAVDITGATVTFDCPSTRDVIITATFDVNCTAFTSTTAFTGQIAVDGVVQPGGAVVTITANGQRTTIATTVLTNLTAGSRTIKIQGRTSAATLTATVTTNSGFTVVG